MAQRRKGRRLRLDGFEPEWLPPVADVGSLPKLAPVPRPLVPPHVISRAEYIEGTLLREKLLRAADLLIYWGENGLTIELAPKEPKKSAVERRAQIRNARTTAQRLLQIMRRAVESFEHLELLKAPTVEDVVQVVLDSVAQLDVYAREPRRRPIDFDDDDPVGWVLSKCLDERGLTSSLKTGNRLRIKVGSTVRVVDENEWRLRRSVAHLRRPRPSKRVWLGLHLRKVAFSVGATTARHANNFVDIVGRAFKKRGIRLP